MSLIEHMIKAGCASAQPKICAYWDRESNICALHRPSAQPETNCSEFPNNSDTISRQAAIDIERNATVDTNPSHFEAHQKFTQFLDDAEISSFGRWQWSNGFNTALTAVGIDLRRLPPAQPERKTGEWVVTSEFEDCRYAKCNQCKVTQVFYYNKPLTNFCPNCGADMREGQNGER